MSFDPLVANPGRLRILTALAVQERQEFVELRHATQLTDGNLASHASRLRAGGLIAIDKQFREGKPVTHITLTTEGRRALESHARRVVAAISQRRLPGAAPLQDPAVSPEPRLIATPVSGEQFEQEDWID